MRSRATREWQRVPRKWAAKLRDHAGRAAPKRRRVSDLCGMGISTRYSILAASRMIAAAIQTLAEVAALLAIGYCGALLHTLRKG